MGESQAKSFSEQETFDSDLTDEDYVEAVLRRMADSLMVEWASASSLTTDVEAGRGIPTIGRHLYCHIPTCVCPEIFQRCAQIRHIWLKRRVWRIAKTPS